MNVERYNWSLLGNVFKMRSNRCKELSGRRLGYLFSICILASVVIYWLITMLYRSVNIDAYFVMDHGDTAMDYFNMLANLRESDPWLANASYPAICFLFWKVMHHFLPIAEYGDGFYLRANMIAQLGYILFSLICILIIWEVVRYMVKGTTSEKVLFSCSVLFSGPMFFLLERGNILIAVFAFSLVFLALYDSEKFSHRLIAYICLAVAAAIKLYPAVLGFLVLYKKRYKETVLLFILGSTVFIAPFFVFDGIESLQKMISGIAVATDVQTGIGLGSNFCISNLIQMVGAFFGKNTTSVPSWVPFASAIFCLCIFIISKQEWQKLYALVLLIIWFPSFSYTYTLVLLFLPIISFFYRSNRQQQGRFRLGYIVGFILLVIPYALPMAGRINTALGLDYIKYPVSWGMVIINITIVILAIMVSIDSIMDRVKDKKILMDG